MQKSKIMLRSLFFLIFSLVLLNTHAQTGLNFQGVARTSNNVILASQAISIKLSILQGSATGTTEYTETRKVTTNAQGLFTAVIGDTGAISTLGNFNTINWKLSPKFLKIEMDPAAGTNFITMGTTQFQYVAYAQFAKSVDAENIVGIIPVTSGGTGVASIAALKTALVIDNLSNTADTAKPISNLTQAALDLKLNITDTSLLLQKADTSSLSNRINAKANADTANFTKDITVNGVGIGMGGGKLNTNTRIGLQALQSNTTGWGNTSIGMNTLKFNTTGFGNTSIGVSSLQNNTFGFLNTSIGAAALAANTFGNGNTASGYQSLLRNTTGSYNTSYGITSLCANTSGMYNTAIGGYTLYINSTGGNNSASGFGALYNNTTGSNNTANGLKSLYNNTTGSNNTATGTFALYSNTSGNGNTAIGNAADVGSDYLTNATAIGSGAIVAASNTIQLGNADVTDVKTNGALTTGAVTYPIAHGTSGQILSTTGSGTLTWTTPGIVSTHTIGETYGGGIVFYVTTDGLHGLIAETIDQSSNCTWYNAQDIISTSANHSTAGKLFTDWRLPTKNELNLLYLQKSMVGGFADVNYWSSTEFDNVFAWSEYFLNPIQSVTNKDGIFFVRAIRAF